MRDSTRHCTVTVQEIDHVLIDVIVLHNDVTWNLFCWSFCFLNDCNRIYGLAYLTSDVGSCVQSETVYWSVSKLGDNVLCIACLYN
jgi:hypothetical protein